MAIILFLFLYAILILGNFEAFSAFKRKLSIIIIDVILVMALLAVLHLQERYSILIFFVIMDYYFNNISDVGGYVFGKNFQMEKINKNKSQ